MAVWGFQCRRVASFCTLGLAGTSAYSWIGANVLVLFSSIFERSSISDNTFEYNFCQSEFFPPLVKGRAGWGSYVMIIIWRELGKSADRFWRGWWCWWRPGFLFLCRLCSAHWAKTE